MEGGGGGGGGGGEVLSPMGLDTERLLERLKTQAKIRRGRSLPDDLNKVVTSEQFLGEAKKQSLEESRIQEDVLQPDGDIMSWIMFHTSAICNRVEEESFFDSEDVYQMLNLAVQLRSWRSYLTSILSILDDLGADSDEFRRLPVGIVSHVLAEERGMLLEVEARVGRVLAALEDRLLQNTQCLLSEGDPSLLLCSRELLMKCIKARTLPQSQSSAGATSHTADPLKQDLRNKAELNMPTLRNKVAEPKPKMPTSRNKGEVAAGGSKLSPFHIEVFDLKAAVAALSGPPMAKLKMQAETKGEVAAGGSQFSPFHIEVFDLKAAVAALSGPPIAKLKMQAETKDEVFLLWEAGEKTVEPPAAAANIRTHVLSAQLKGHDTDHQGRVDYQLFSPLIDFNLEEESSLQPGRHTDALVPSLKSSANVLSIKVADTIVGFPINLYGSVFVRDTLDNEGIYLFRRERGDSQLINSKDETLFLIGPSRGLVVFDYLTFEFDLKIRLGDQQADDLDFSQGTIEYNSVSSEPPFISDKLSSELSTMELNYAPVQRALEATVEIRIAQDSSKFPASTKSEDERKGLVFKLYGKISACYTSSTEEIVLFDSNASGTMFTVGDDGVLELWRRVLSVCVQDSLVVTVETWGDDDGEAVGLSRAATKSSFVFSPLLCGEGRAIVPFAHFKMQIKVVWSALYSPKLDD